MRKVNPKRTEERLTKQEAESLIREIKDFMEYVGTNATEVSKTNVYKSSAQFLNMQLMIISRQEHRSEKSFRSGEFH